MTDKLIIQPPGTRTRGTKRNGGPTVEPTVAKVTHQVTWTDAAGKHQIRQRSRADAFKLMHDLRTNGLRPEIKPL